MMKLKAETGFPQYSNVASLFWLGQAGFWIDTGQFKIIIDPYLSNSLAIKYAGRENDHVRMMPPPITVPDLPQSDIVLITHAHTDHMDPDTLGPIYERFPHTLFVVPAAALQTARHRIHADAQIIGVDADDVIQPLDRISVRVFPAAHEELDRDDLGRHHYLGYGIETHDLKIYHSGDSIPFDGLSDRIRNFAPDIALLPVNGRDDERLQNGIPGNFTLAEAIELSRTVPILVPHHFGMFSFNTLDPAIIDTAAAHHSEPSIMRPIAGVNFRIVKP